MATTTRTPARSTTARHLDAYRSMLLSRRLDERCSAMLEAGQPVPHFHSGVGQEALSVAAAGALREDDQMIYTHRGVGHLLGKGVPVREIVLDLFLRAGGTNDGLGGVLHVSRPDLGVPGREGVFGTRFGISVGMALAAKRRGSDAAVMCFYGEAAGARGQLYEALNMAVLWSLPIVFVAENNGWSFSSRTEWLFPESRMSRVWRGFEIPVEEVDGNDAEAVMRRVDEALGRARAGRGPSVLEGLTYRIDPHIYWDEDRYRSAEEISAWAARDPLARSRARLEELGLSAAELEAVETSAGAELDAAFQAAERAPDPVWRAS